MVTKSEVNLDDEEALKAFRSIEESNLVDKVVQLRKIYKEPLEGGVIQYTFIGMFNIHNSSEVSTCTIQLLDRPNENPRYKAISMQAVL
jgi:hypothetical protein